MSRDWNRSGVDWEAERAAHAGREVLRCRMHARAELSGPKSRYRGKLRGSKTMSITFTPAGHEALALRLAATGLSRSDYLESLVRKDAARSSPTDTPQADARP